MPGGGEAILGVGVGPPIEGYGEVKLLSTNVALR